ncbi:MAG: hypothetical protein ACTSYT_03620 [Candidatus Asgardarchaeia archaeon]
MIILVIWRILNLSFKVALRSTRRFVAFTVIYSILLMNLSLTLKGGDIYSPELLTQATFSILAGLLVAVIYSFILSHFRRIEIATLKCLGWDNNSIRIFIIGEIFLVTLVSFGAILEVTFHILGVLYYFLGEAISDITFLRALLIPIGPLFTSLAIVLLVQVPGILITTYTILRIRPIDALRRAK